MGMVVKNLPARAGYVAALLLAVVMLILFLGPFWWPGESSSWAAFIRAALVIALLCAAPALSRRSFFISPLTCTVLLLFVYLLINSLMADDDLKSMRRILLILVFFVGVGLVRPSGAFDWEKILKLSVVVVALFAAFSMLNLALHGAFVLGYRQMLLASSGVPDVADFGNTIVAGMNYGLFLLGGVWLMLRSRRRAEIALWLACCAVIAIYIYFTFARSAWLASSVGGLVLLSTMTSGKLRRNILIPAAVIVVLVLIFGFSELAYEVQTRGVTGRNEVWLAVFERLSGHWWFGVGAGTPLGDVRLSTGQVVRNTHGLYFEVLYQFGIVGLALLLATMLHAGGCLMRARHTSVIACLWLALLCSVGVVMTVELHTFVGSPNVVWEWLWLPLAGAVAISREARRAEG
jgi:O-antigen ligase